jgi:hypothetical protein
VSEKSGGRVEKRVVGGLRNKWRVGADKAQAGGGQKTSWRAGRLFLESKEELRSDSLQSNTCAVEKYPLRDQKKKHQDKIMQGSAD